MKMDEDDKKIRISQITSPADPWEDFQKARVLQLETFPREPLCNNNDGQGVCVMLDRSYLRAMRTLTLSISAWLVSRSSSLTSPHRPP